MTTMTEQEQIRVLREVLQPFLTDPGAGMGHVHAARKALAATASIQPVAAPEPVAWAICDGVPRAPILTVYSASEAASYRSDHVVPLYTAAPAQAAEPEPVAHDRNEKLLNFIDSVVEVAFEGGDLDGGTIQEWAETAGLLEARTMAEPCSEGQNCRCADGDDFPLTCYQKTYSRTAAPAQVASDEARVKKLEKALRPFAKLAKAFEGNFDTDLIMGDFRGKLTIGHIREAERALRTTSTNKGETA